MQKDIIGVYTEEEKVVSAVKQLDEQGLQVKDVYTPYPVVELMEAMKLKTRFPYFAFAFGVMGVSLTFAFLYYTSVLSYPLVIGGKPHLSLAFVVILFIMTILVTIVTSLIAFFVREKKGPGQVAKMYHPDITDDKFVLVVNQDEKMTDENATIVSNILKSTGAIEIEEREIEEDEDEHHSYSEHTGATTQQSVGETNEMSEVLGISEKVITCAEKVYDELGSWLLEDVYKEALVHDIRELGLSAEKDVYMPVTYKKGQIDNAYQIDILVNKQVLISIKLVDEFINNHIEQTLKYMHLSNCKIGLLLNFNAKSFEKGVKKLM